MSEDFVVRSARKADIPAIDMLLSRSYPRLLKPDYAPSVLVTAVPLITKAQPKLVVSGTYYVAEEPGGRIIGVGGWTPQGPMGEKDAGAGHIRHFGTDPDATRRGVARRLMEKCITDARASEIRHMECYSTLTAQPFYKSMGFSKVGHVSIELRPGIAFPAIRMVRDL